MDTSDDVLQLTIRSIARVHKLLHILKIDLDTNLLLTFLRKAQVLIMATRIKENRQLLLTKLRELGTPGDWSHISTQIGMFSYTGLHSK